MDEDIPPLTSPDNLAPIRTQDDLHRVWRMLIGPLGFGGHSLWVLLLDPEGRPASALMQIEDLPPLPDLKIRENLTRLMRRFPDEGSVVFLLTRPGRTPITAGERRWGQVLTEVVRRAGLPSWPIHRANDLELVAITPDDLAASA